MNYKRFSEMQCSSVLNEKSLRYLDAWTTLRDDQKYVSLILRTLKAIYTRFRCE